MRARIGPRGSAVEDVVSGGRLAPPTGAGVAGFDVAVDGAFDGVEFGVGVVGDVTGGLAVGGVGCSCCCPLSPPPRGSNVYTAPPRTIAAATPAAIAPLLIRRDGAGRAAGGGAGSAYPRVWTGAAASE